MILFNQPEPSDLTKIEPILDQTWKLCSLTLPDLITHDPENWPVTPIVTYVHRQSATDKCLTIEMLATWYYSQDMLISYRFLAERRQQKTGKENAFDRHKYNNMFYEKRGATRVYMRHNDHKLHESIHTKSVSVGIEVGVFDCIKVPWWAYVSCGSRQQGWIYLIFSFMYSVFNKLQEHLKV